jgi:hypothetical protein|tara:strand:- start:1554 stop:2429 length:876 start_codon:yes stop_codon:yes gene_type:complete
MSTQITKAFEQDWSDTFIHLSQQKPSKLAEAVRAETVTDAKAFHFDRMDTVIMQKAVSRHEDTPLTEIPYSRRRVTFDTYRGADLIDSPDKVKMSKDPTSPTMQTLLWSMNRQKDDLIIAAASGNAVSISDSDAASNVALPSAQKIAHGSADLSLAKLIEAKKILLDADVDPEAEPMYACIGPAQLEALLNDSTITSSDYNTVKALVNGDINTFMGFKFIVSTRLTVASSIRVCLFWAKSALGLAMNGNAKTRITERSDKNYSTQVFLEASMGATRIEDEKLVEVSCDESA